MNALRTAAMPEALRHGDPGYDLATRMFFGTSRPALVIRPRGPDDILAALDYAARHDLAVAVRSGGHSPLGHTADADAVLLDLAFLDDVEILDHDRRLVRVGGGATWGKVAAALDPHDWALTAGDTADVGVGGLTLGGGIGWLVRRHGLAIDNLVGARVVTADGQLLTTSRGENPELFWALRGGGGNFGVVVDFDFVAQPVGSVHFGAVTYRLDDLAELLTRWRDAMRCAPEELSSTLAFPPQAPGAAPSATLLLCYAGEPGGSMSEADAAIEPLLELGTASMARISERRYFEVLEQAERPPGVRLATRNILVTALDHGVTAAVRRLRRTSPVPTVVAVRSLGGAVARVRKDATAFAHRDAEAMIVGLFLLPGTASDADVEQALVPWNQFAAHGVGTYLNFQGAATDADLAAAYPPETRSRLAAAKRTYDPGNRFALNHNITPGPSSEDAR